MVKYRRARKTSEDIFRLPDNSLVSIVVWELPYATGERPHGYKYRLNYCSSDGTTLVRYDNKRGKGNHRHYYNHEEPYDFTTLDQLLEDFWSDVDKILRKD